MPGNVYTVNGTYILMAFNAFERSGGYHAMNMGLYYRNYFTQSGDSFICQQSCNVYIYLSTGTIANNSANDGYFTINGVKKASISSGNSHKGIYTLAKGDILQAFSEAEKGANNRALMIGTFIVQLV